MRAVANIAAFSLIITLYYNFPFISSCAFLSDLCLLFAISDNIVERVASVISALNAWDYSQDLGNLGLDLGFGDFAMQSWDFYCHDERNILSEILTF